MTYQKALHKEMLRLVKDERVVFIGYNVRYGHKMYGTLLGAPPFAALEMPVAESLMMGVGMGMALEGYRPVVCFERMDFTLVAADAIVNEMDKLPLLSGGQFNFPMTVRVIVGNNQPLDPGMQHCGDYTELFKQCSNAEVRQICNKTEIKKHYADALTRKHPAIIIEYKKLYNER